MARGFLIRTGCKGASQRNPEAAFVRCGFPPPATVRVAGCRPRQSPPIGPREAETQIESNQPGVFGCFQYTLFNLGTLWLEETDDWKCLSFFANVAWKSHEVTSVVFHNRKAINRCTVVL